MYFVFTYLFWKLCDISNTQHNVVHSEAWFSLTIEKIKKGLPASFQHFYVMS